MTFRGFDEHCWKSTPPREDQNEQHGPKNAFARPPPTLFDAQHQMPQLFGLRTTFEVARLQWHRPGTI